MPEVIEERSGHVLVKEDDGSVELITLSPFNRLLYKHNLFGLLRDQEESLELSNDEWDVTITPLGEQKYEVDIEDAITATLKPHEKSALVDALVDAYDVDDDAPSPVPVVDGVKGLRDYDVLPAQIDPLAEVPTFEDAVEVVEDGWLIHGYLLLTYSNEFVNTRTDTHTRSGNSVRPVDNANAYGIRFRKQARLDDDYSTSSDDARFIARAKWAVDNARR